MRSTTLVVLAGITVVVFAAAVFVPAPGGTQGSTVATGPVFPTLKNWIAGAAKLTVTGANGSVTLTHTGPTPKAGGSVIADGWVLADKGNYPVDPATIRPILAGLVALKTVEPKTERPKLYDRLDLANPGKGSEAKSVMLADSSGADILTLIVGRRRYGLTGGDDGLYVRKPDDARAWLASPAFDLPGDTLSWIDRKLVDIDADQIKSISLTPAAAGAKPLTLGRDKAADKMAIQDLPKDFKPKADNPGSDLAAAFRYLDLTDVEPAAALTAAPIATAHVETFDGMVLDVTLVDQDNVTWVEFAAKGTGDGAKTADEITKRTHGWAYKIPDARIKTLETRLADLQAPPPAKGS